MGIECHQLNVIVVSLLLLLLGVDHVLCYTSYKSQLGNIPIPPKLVTQVFSDVLNLMSKYPITILSRISSNSLAYMWTRVVQGPNHSFIHALMSRYYNERVKMF